MKKIFLFILSFTYLVTTTGASVEFHYCMNQLVSWSLMQDEGKTCDNCGMDTDAANKNCCKEEHKLFKVENDQKVNIESFQIAKFSPSELLHFFNNTERPLINCFVLIPQSNAPPRSHGIDIYIINRNFRI